MTGDRHNSNAELLGQGVANLVSPLVGGIPVTGATARTATNFRSGARTPVSGLVHALTLLAIVLVLAPLATNVPLATLAALSDRLRKTGRALVLCGARRQPAALLTLVDNR